MKTADTFPSNPSLKPFSLVAKPTGSLCNLNCRYCFYLQKHLLYQDNPKTLMSDVLLEEYIRQYIDAQPIPEVQFVWQGGEPTLMGLNFFQKAVSLQRKYAGGKRVANSFQTNGILIDDAWCRFFYENRFLVGISIDGPREFHDRHRRTGDDAPTFKKILRTIERLKKHQVEFNTLTVVNRDNADFPLEVYRFLKSIGSHYMQFIPIVERRSGEADSPLLSNEPREDALVTEWSVDALQYGQFLNAIFNEWVRQDVGQYFVQMFDAALANWMGVPPGVCVLANECGNAGVLEHNGDVYSCDHFVFPEHCLGNIREQSLKEMMNSARQKTFGENKFTALPRECKECTYLTKCWGECPRNRILVSRPGEYGLNYLCEGLKAFFAHITPAMEFMANEMIHQRPPANIMAHPSFGRISK